MRKRHAAGPTPKPSPGAIDAFVRRRHRPFRATVRSDAQPRRGRVGALTSFGLATISISSERRRRATASRGPGFPDGRRRQHPRDSGRLSQETHSHIRNRVPDLNVHRASGEDNQRTLGVHRQVTPASPTLPARFMSGRPSRSPLRRPHALHVDRRGRRMTSNQGATRRNVPALRFSSARCGAVGSRGTCRPTRILCHPPACPGRAPDFAMMFPFGRVCRSGDRGMIGAAR